jgi:hypothetical protein
MAEQQLRERQKRRERIFVEIELCAEDRALLERLCAPHEPNNHQQVLARLEEINLKLDKHTRNLKEIKAMNAETQRLLGELDAASTELATDIQTLIDRAEAAGSLTAEEINNALAPKVEFLKQLGANTNAPIPEVPPPTPEPEP